MRMGGQITDGIRLTPEPAMTSPGRRAGYGSLRVVNAYGHRGLD